MGYVISSVNSPLFDEEMKRRFQKLIKEKKGLTKKKE
jgi:hypothetical protein